METIHSENESPFVAKDDFGTSEQILGPAEIIEASEEHLVLVDCPRENCGEIILLAELENHTSMHDVENGNEEENLHQESNRNKRSRVSEPESELKFDTRLPLALRNLGSYDISTSSSSSNRQEVAKAGWRELWNTSSSRGKPWMSTESKRPHRRLGVSTIVCVLILICD